MMVPCKSPVTNFEGPKCRIVLESEKILRLEVAVPK